MRTETHEIRGEVEAFTLRLFGEVSYQDATELRLGIDDALARPFEQVVFALGAVEQMDTAGAALLVEAVLEGRRRGKRVLLCSPSDPVMKMFELTGLEEVFDACCATPDVTWQRLQATA